MAARYHFVPPSVFPAMIGTMVSWASNDQVHIWYFFLMLLGLTLNHIALNMTDDYFDFKHAVDTAKSEEKNPYTGGSGTLTSGKIQPRAMLRFFSVLYVFVIVIGMYLTIERGLVILFFGLFGVLCSIFYTAPPIKFSHHGFGELGLLINFGPIIGLGSFFVQSQMITLEAFFATLPCGVMLFSMIIINEIPDLNDDILAGKITLIARVGPRVGSLLYISSWIATYTIVLVGIITTILPLALICCFISIPLVIRSVLILSRTYENPSRMAPANLAMIQAHALTSLGLIAGYGLHGITQQRNINDLLIIVIIFLLFYLPATISITHRKKIGIQSVFKLLSTDPN